MGFAPYSYAYDTLQEDIQVYRTLSAIIGYYDYLIKLLFYMVVSSCSQRA
jgi:hypothetical protein